MNWEEATNEFNKYLQLEKSASKNTIDGYLNDLKKFQNFLNFRKYSFQPFDIQAETIQEYLAITFDLGISPRTQARLISSLNSFYKYFIYDGIIENNPIEKISLPKLSTKFPETLSVPEIDLILEKIDYSQADAHRNRALLETLYGCGLRVSELINLKLSNIFPKIGFIKIIGKGNKERLVPLGSYALKHINLYLNHYRNHLTIDKKFEDILFLTRNGNQLSRQMIFLIVKKLVALAGIKKNVSPHTFRHSFATHLVEGGADLIAIQQMLGHASITTTEIYAHMNKEYLRDTIIQFHPRK